jgi:hypothetical protein
MQHAPWFTIVGRLSPMAARTGWAAALLLTACASGTDSVAPPAQTPPPPTLPCVISAIAITPTSVTLMEGQGGQLNATVSSQNCTTPPAIAWSTSDAARAQVSTTGVVTAIAEGVATITATAGAVSAQAVVTITANVEARRFAYGVADRPDAPLQEPYAPDAALSAIAGSDIRVSRIDVGQYVLSLPDYSRESDSPLRDMTMVTAVGTAGERCGTDRRFTSGGSQGLVFVSCVSIAGAPVNARFAIAFVGSRSLAGRMAFITNPVTTPFFVFESQGFTSTGAAQSLDRTQPGVYQLGFGLPIAGASALLVTPYGLDRNAVCGSSLAVTAAGAARVQCASAANGAPVDAEFASLLLESGRIGRRWGFATSTELAPALGTPYTPPASTQAQSNGQSVSITRIASGQYQVRFPGLGAGSGTETLHVGPFGAGPSAACQLGGWTRDGADILADVRCWGAGSPAPADSRFVIVLLE